MKRFLAWCITLVLLTCSASSASALGEATNIGKGDGSGEAGNTMETKANEDYTFSSKSDFPLKLFQQAVKDKVKENVLVSPFSASTALTMAWSGADGGTREQMGRVLGLPEGSTDAKIFAEAKRVLESLKVPGGGTQLDMANALFGSQNVKFTEEYLKAIKQNYDAEVSSLDFGSPAAVTTINSWVSEKTHGKIAEIVKQLDANTALCLINAIYFNGKWDKPFKKTDTKQASFHLLDGSLPLVDMMSTTRHFEYLETEDFQAVQIPYADGRLRMFVFLPVKAKALDVFEAELTQSKWLEWLNQFSERTGTLSMPRFKIESSLLLNDALSKMGMPVAFQGGHANFTGMAPDEEIFISKVIHKTYMDVTEEGTEAAAVTAIVASRGFSFAPKRPFSMVVDRPFLIAIRDVQTGSTLFMGHVANPAGAPKEPETTH